jgi:hypothetical protein
VAHVRSFLGFMYTVQNEDKYNENCAIIGRRKQSSVARLKTSAGVHVGVNART